MRMSYYDNDDDVDKVRKKKLKVAEKEANLLERRMEDKMPPIFGICTTCEHFLGAETKYGDVFARCYEFNVRLSAADPIIKCTYYKKAGQMDIQDMKEMAILIEIDKKQIGFIKNDK